MSNHTHQTWFKCNKPPLCQTLKENPTPMYNKFIYVSTIYIYLSCLYTLTRLFVHHSYMKTFTFFVFTLQHIRKISCVAIPQNMLRKTEWKTYTIVFELNYVPLKRYILPSLSHYLKWQSFRLSQLANYFRTRHLSSSFWSHITCTLSLKTYAN